MAISDVLRAKQERLQEKLKEKSQKSFQKAQETGEASESKIDSGDWVILFLASLFVDFGFVILSLVGAIPFIGQVFYAVTAPILSAVTSFILWLYLQHKGLGQYWWIAFGLGLGSTVPILNWFVFTIGILVIYTLSQAEKIPLGGKIIEKTAKLASVAKK